MPATPSAQTSAQAAEIQVGPAGTGDHHAIYDFLLAVFRGPPRDIYLASLDDPFYEPSDRLVAKRGDKVLAHVHTTKRAMHFDGEQLAVGGLGWLGTLTELRGQGYGRQLLRLAERRMTTERALAGVLRTRIPRFFRAAGWAVCGRHSHTRASAREVLAQLANLSASARQGGSAYAGGGTDAVARGTVLARAAACGAAAPLRLSVRPWRQVELPALMRLYLQAADRACGAFHRTESYWRWIISSKQFDHIFVAVEGPDKLDWDDTASRIVGYVITRDDEILELAFDSRRPDAALDLVERACGEAVERNVHAVRFHGPPGHLVHDLFQLARGERHCHEVHDGEVFMVKLLDPGRFLGSLCGLLHHRAEEAGLPRPCELGLLVEEQKLRLVVSRRSVKLTRNRLGRSYLEANVAEFTRLVLGHLDLDQAIATGRLAASTRLALDTARALFPPRPLWRSPLDDLMS